MNLSGTVPNAAILLATHLSALELALIHPFTALTVAFNLLLLLNTKLLHVNLKFILLSQSASILMCECCRIVYVSLKFANADMFFNGAWLVQMAALISTNFRNSLIYALLAERVLATVQYRKYGKWKKPYFGTIIVAVLLNLAVWLSIIQNGTPWSVDSRTVIVFGIITAIGVIQIIIVGILWKLNYGNYQSGIALDLNHKFQLCENIRTARQLAPTFIFHLVNLCANSSPIFLLYFKLIDRPYLASICFLLAAIVNGIGNFLIELTVITHHPMLKRKALRWLRIIPNFLKGSKVGASTHLASYKAAGQAIRDINGRQLDNLPGREFHFKMLRNSWE